jgi:lysophospholipase L1-like esterase
MNRKIKAILTPLLAVSLTVLSIVPARAAETRNHIDYVAMGDSVAAGVLLSDVHYPNEGSGLGYTDNIAAKLDYLNVLESFNMELARAGKTAKELAAETAELNVPNSPKWHLVKDAELVTLDIGANDLLGGFYASVANIKDKANPTDLEKFAVVNALRKIQTDLLTGKGEEIKSDIKKILQNILNANKHVKIYVMEYYNPLPVLSQALGMDFNQSVEILNTCIEAAINDVCDDNKKASISYVRTMSVMATSPYNLYPTDIHPSEIGYRVIAEEFLKKIEPTILKNK